MVVTRPGLLGSGSVAWWLSGRAFLQALMGLLRLARGASVFGGRILPFWRDAASTSATVITDTSILVRTIHWKPTHRSPQRPDVAGDASISLGRPEFGADPTVLGNRRSVRDGSGATLAVGVATTSSGMAHSLSLTQWLCPLGLRQDHPMAKSIPALVEPAVLRWARESIDLEPIAASRKLGLDDGRVTARRPVRIDRLSPNCARQLSCTGGPWGCSSCPNHRRDSTRCGTSADMRARQPGLVAGLARRLSPGTCPA
jgi:hypothetical protein